MGTFFGVQKDFLHHEIAKAQNRLSEGKVSLMDAVSGATVQSSRKNHPASKICDMLESEFRRVSEDILRQQYDLELLTKGLLNTVENALEKAGQQHSETSFKTKADHLKNCCLELHRLLTESKAALVDIAQTTDAKLGTSHSKVLERRMAADDPWKDGLSSSLVVVLSDIYDAIRSLEEVLRKKGSGKADQKWVAPSSFERSTTKYWVKESELMELLLTSASEVPLLVYGRSGRLTSASDSFLQGPSGDMLWSELASPISSVYFDSKDMSLYKERIIRSEGAQLLRARWYGRKPSGGEMIFLELKTHHEKWINTKSLKERVEIRERDMRKFLKRDPWGYADAEDMVLAAKPTLAGDKLDEAVDRLLRMHNLVVKHSLRPTVRSVYQRVAFQSAKGNDLRLTIDRCVTLIDETKNSSSGSWCLPEDALIDNSMVVTVPFVVFEMKLAGEDPMPSSLRALEARGVIQEATKFSKFLTGAAAFNHSKVNMLPYWADHPSFAELFSGDQQKQDDFEGALYDKMQGAQASFDSDTSKTAEGSSSSQIEVTPFTNTEDRYPSSGRPSLLRPVKTALFRRNKANSSSRRSKQKSSHPTVAAKTPVRVEPKSYFANERTFIQWISASLLMLTISVLLLGYDAQQGATSTSSFARNSGIGVCCGAVLIILYATFVYLRRIKLLSTGNPYGYIDYLGPSLLAVAVMIGVLVLLVEFSLDIRVHWNSQSVFLREEPGQCYRHSMEGITNLLEFQPSDVIIDYKRDLLLVSSVQQISGHSLHTGPSSGDATNLTLLEIPQTDLEGMTSTFAGDRIFALSEGPELTELIEIAFVSSDQSNSNGNSNNYVNANTESNSMESEVIQVDDIRSKNPNEMKVVGRWTLAASASQAEAIMFVPGKADNEDRLYIDMDNFIRTYDIPSQSGGPLNQRSLLNKGVIEKGLNHNPKIAAMTYFEGVAYFLHDNEMVIRAWDLEKGKLLAEMPVPHVRDGASNQWEGLSLERRSVASYESDSFLGGGPVPSSGSLRGRTQNSNNGSALILHLTLDTPAEIWSILVEEGESRGSLKFPSCAAAKHFTPPHSDEALV